MASSLEMERARKQKSLGVVPYKGTEPFIFVSYAHRDFDKVIPIIKALIDYGFRVWYDEGIDPGAEWDANIAEHVEGCYCMLSILSRNYLASNNCLDELSYARDLEKKQMFVYLESVKLPGSLALRFGRLQAIHQYTYLQQEAFYEKLFSASVMEPTLKASARRKSPPPAGKPVQASPVQQKPAPNPRASELQAIAALFEYEQHGESIIITALKDKNRTAVEIPKGVTRIGNKTFYWCEKITSVTIPNSVTSIGDEAFSGCTSLKNITIPNSVTSIGTRAFSSCHSLTTFTIPRSIHAIGDYTFSCCKRLTSITLPNSITSIGFSAFSDCDQLTTIDILNSSIDIANGAFSRSPKLTIRGTRNSRAESYARKNNIPYERLQTTPPPSVWR